MNSKGASGTTQFAVVKFLTEDLVEAVSLSWLIDEGNKCYWPDSTLNYKKSSEKTQSPNFEVECARLFNFRSVWYVLQHLNNDRCSFLS